EDESVPGVDIDLRYTGALSNRNEGLRLLDKDCMLVDEVLADPAWPAGDDVSRRTMERADDLSWQTFLGEEAMGGIWGTPKADNSEEEEVEDDEEEDEADDTQEDELDEDEDPIEDDDDEKEEEEEEEESLEDEEGVEDEGGEEATPELININTASLDDLQNITGVGPVIAQRIIDYREANGFFASIEEIKEVDGIGDVTFEEMKDEITIGGG
ncbi:MAG: ComEA family DNA-binding protein, partial [Candidatus Colwellbacteria bacterium]